MRPVRTAARAMLAGIFVAGGAKALAHPDPLVPRAAPIVDRVGPTLARIHKRAPSDARSLVQLNGAVQFVGGLALLTGLRRPAAIALAGSLVPTTLAGHRFWEVHEPALREQQQNHFLKNLGLLGGLLLVALDTEGRPGLRYLTERLARDAGRTVRRGARDAERTVRRGARNTRRSVRVATRAAEIGRWLPG